MRHLAGAEAGRRRSLGILLVWHRSGGGRESSERDVSDRDDKRQVDWRGVCDEWDASLTARGPLSLTVSNGKG